MFSTGPKAALNAAVDVAKDVAKISTGQKDPSEFGNTIAKASLGMATAQRDFACLKLPPVSPT